jgi:integrase
MVMDADEMPRRGLADGRGGDDAAAGTAGALLAEFSSWLARERSLSPVTVRCYAKQARGFLGHLPGPVDAALRELDAGRVTAFMVGYCRDRNTWSAKAMVTALRALLRFLRVSGRTPVVLAGAVPAVAGWRLASLPRGLTAAEVEQLLGGCDRGTVTGGRDYAILTVLARLGLRGAEAAGLQLPDIDWRVGEVAICGKGSRVERLPLPVPVGEALAAWLTGGRARCGPPAVFVTVRAPYPSFFVSARGTRLDAHNITRAFARLAADAGIGAPPGRRRPRLHDLRHSFTVASLLDLYRDGGDVAARLPLLSTWLGHVDPKSTYWYLQAVPELLALAADRLEQAFPFKEPPA